MVIATLVAAALDLGVAATAFLLSILESHSTSSDHDDVRLKPDTTYRSMVRLKPDATYKSPEATYRS